MFFGVVFHSFFLTTFFHTTAIIWLPPILPKLLVILPHYQRQQRKYEDVWQVWKPCELCKPHLYLVPLILLSCAAKVGPDEFNVAFSYGISNCDNMNNMNETEKCVCVLVCFQTLWLIYSNVNWKVEVLFSFFCYFHRCCCCCCNCLIQWRCDLSLSLTLARCTHYGFW